MCPVHHDVIDGRPDLFPIERLEAIKKNQEAKFEGGTEPSDAVATSLLRNSGLLEELVELARTQVRNSEEQDRPRFQAGQAGATRLSSDYQPRWKVRQVSGDPVANIEWRFRGRRVTMDRRQAQGSRLADTNFSNRFDITQVVCEDDLVGENELGFELRFHWHGRWRIEIHRCPLSFRTTGDKGELTDVGDEILPALEMDEGEEP